MIRFYELIYDAAPLPRPTRSVLEFAAPHDGKIKRVSIFAPNITDSVNLEFNIAINGQPVFLSQDRLKIWRDKKFTFKPDMNTDFSQRDIIRLDLEVSGNQELRPPIYWNLGLDFLDRLGGDIFGSMESAVVEKIRGHEIFLPSVSRHEAFHDDFNSFEFDSSKWTTGGLFDAVAKQDSGLLKFTMPGSSSRQSVFLASKAHLVANNDELIFDLDTVSFGTNPPPNPEIVINAGFVDVNTGFYNDGDTNSAPFNFFGSRLTLTPSSLRVECGLAEPGTPIGISELLLGLRRTFNQRVNLTGIKIRVVGSTAQWWVRLKNINISNAGDWVYVYSHDFSPSGSVRQGQRRSLTSKRILFAVNSNSLNDTFVNLNSINLTNITDELTDRNYLKYDRLIPGFKAGMAEFTSNIGHFSVTVFNHRIFFWDAINKCRIFDIAWSVWQRSNIGILHLEGYVLRATQPNTTVINNNTARFLPQNITIEQGKWNSKSSAQQNYMPDDNHNILNAGDRLMFRILKQTNSGIDKGLKIAVRGEYLP